MENRMKRLLYVWAGALLLVSIGSPIIAGTWFRATLEDILHDPERYYGLQLRITGKAVEPSSRGYYVENDIGTRIEIISQDLPIFDIKYDVYVRVVERENYYMPDLIEVERKKFTGGYSWLILSVVIGFMGFISVGG